MDEKDQASEAARRLSAFGASKGGLARALALSPQQRSDQASHAARSRWASVKSGGQVVRCRFCGKLYKFYAHTARDQSACPACVREAEENS